MSLKIKVEVINSGDTPINNSSWCRISEVVRFVLFRWVESGVMSFSHDDDRNFGLVGFPKTSAGFTNQRKFVLDHSLELTCSNQTIR